MLIATVTTLIILFGGGAGFSFGVFKDAIKEQIKDKERRKELVAEIDRADAVLKTYRKELKSFSKNLVETNARHDATRGEFDAIAARADVRRIQMTRELLDARFALRDKMTEDEWNAMYERAQEKARDE
jgi:hypothetical protein